MASDHITAVDLFCGAGGFSTGLALTCEQLDVDCTLHAINHWERAIETHEANHPWAHRYHSKVEELHPPAVVDGPVDILVAGPECTHFSNARGGKPVSEQQRASPWHVLDWLEKLDVEAFLIENVRELESWGPVEDGQPTRNGEIFDAWIDALHALGYSVEWRVLNAADYGDPTSRERLFVVGRQDHRGTFPAPTHSEYGGPDTRPWRPAAEIIDWSDPGGSIWTRDLDDPRKKPLKHTTMQRIAEGIRRHCDECLAPLADALAELGREDVKRLRERPIPARYARVAARTLDEPFLVAAGPGQAPALTTPAVLGQHSNSVARDVTARPTPTVTTGGKLQLLDPDAFLLRQQSGGVPAPVADPCPTVAATGAIGKIECRTLVKPKNYPHRGIHSNPPYPPETRPHHTVTSDPRSKLVTPYLCPLYNGRESQRPRTRALDRPLMTVPASKSPAGLASPYLVKYYGTGTARPIDEPVDTITADGNKFGVATPVCQPFLDDYEGPPDDVRWPLGTLTTRDRYALCVPGCYPWGLDVRYRMFQPRELKQAQGFPADYEIVGNQRETKKQIGNAVPVNLAQALITHLLVDKSPDLRSYGSQEVTADDD